MPRNVGPPSFKRVTRLQPRADPYPIDWKEQSKSFKESAIKQCERCKHPGSMANPLQTDHIIPKSKSGKDIEANYRVLCKNCNMARNSIGKRARRR